MELMQRQLDDDLSDAELEVLMNHTRQCPDCAAMFERMKQLSADLTALPKVTPSYSLVDAILPELERLDRLAASVAPAAESASVIPARVVSEPRRMPRKRRWTTWSAIGSVVAAGIVAGLFIMNDPAAIDDHAGSQLSYSADMPADAGATANMFRQTDTISGQSDIEFKANEKESPQGLTDEGSHNPGAGGDVSIKGMDDSVTGKGIVTDRAESVDQSGALTEAPGEPDVRNEDHPNLGIAAANAFPSPDGRYVALLDQHAISIVSTDDGKSVMQTSRKNGQHSQIAWSDDSSQLTYEVQLDRGAAEKYVIQSSNWKEKKATH
ncbi:anti-sigma factor [Paenibacillus sp. 1011MAR3C5]|uniref:anti-sigma factor family protein n=1 Tax=Paenibacillus sp. 1011MAR3C5 TaxID=1675787 RepID=UPI0021760EF5|nr:zf-HC2 domain-containing protein [Paenibacillus sp. 1011MAR3C5]